ncbi:MAG: hypothetical protein BGO09_04145 [Bacteroidetes bacterium 47-18]|nr:MAG: hypothetical protein BGO09_04145 [Bacteroidetes bacterium 47-18]
MPSTTRQRAGTAKIRKMRICRRYFERQTGCRFAVFPDIRLSGRWLQDSGFEAGQYIRIAHRHRHIIITVIPGYVTAGQLKNNVL